MGISLLRYRARRRATTVVASLLTLPAELRVHIFRFLLTSAQPLTIYFDSPPHVLANGLHPAVLRTCKSIHTEAEDLLYNFNTFRIDIRQAMGFGYPHGLRIAIALYRPLFIQDIPEVSWIRRHLPRWYANVVQKGVLTPNTLRKMKHLEIVTDEDTYGLQTMMTRLDTARGKLLLDILRTVGDSEIVEEPAREDRQNASLRIRTEQKYVENRTVTYFKDNAKVLEVLRNVLARRKFDAQLVKEHRWYESDLTVSEIHSTEYFVALFKESRTAGNDDH